MMASEQACDEKQMIENEAKRLREEIDVRTKMESAAMSTEHMEKMAQERMSVVMTESHAMDALERLKKERETEKELALSSRAA